MIEPMNGLVGLCKADQTFPAFWNFHCIIYREQLVSKSLKLDNVMKTVMEIVNCIRTHALNHWQFKNLIAELDQGLPGDLPLHCTVGWLSKSQVLSRFFQLLDAVKLFMEEKNQNYPELSDFKWIMDLAFLVDMLCHLNRLNQNLQGKLKILPDLVQSVSAFVNKLNLFKAHIQRGDLTHFPNLLKASGQVTIAILNKQKAIYATLLETLKKSFVSRFRDLLLKRSRLRSSSTHLIRSGLFENLCCVIKKCANGKIPQSGLCLRYRQCLGQHTSASCVFNPKTHKIKASICTD